MIKDGVTECQCDFDSDQISKATEAVICKTQVPASSQTIDFISKSKEVQQSDPLFDSNVEEQALQSHVDPHQVDYHLLPMCRMVKDGVTECQWDVDSDQTFKATEELICEKLNSDANKETIPQCLPMSFTFGDWNSHKFLLINIPTNILESIYSAVVEFPLTQYEVICSALKQICLYKSFHMLFPNIMICGSNWWKC
jgi:hypothetical protein